MEKFKKNLQNLKVPYIEDKQFEENLRYNLLHNFFSRKDTVFKIKFKIASALAALFLALFISVLIKPNIASKINNIAFGNKKDAELEKVLFTLPDDKTDYNSIVYKSEKGQNPFKEFPEEKRYIIHRYITNGNKRVTVVSEVPINKKNSVKIIY